MISKAFGLAFVLAVVSQGAVQAADGFDFAAYRVETIYKGKLRLPDFKGHERKFAPFKTHIVEAMKAGVSFAGEFSVAQFGCGSGCTMVVVANNRTGELHDFPRGGESNQALALQFKANSNLLLARWFTDSLWETCVIEALVFEGGKWIAKAAIAVRGDEACMGEIAQGAGKARGY